MVFDSKIHHRRSIRLKEYDYSQNGAYFVTICTRDSACLFGEVINGVVYLNDAGNIVHTVWDDLPNHYDGIVLDAFVAMPNHVHGIIIITNSIRADRTERAGSAWAGLKPVPTNDGNEYAFSVGAGLQPAHPHKLSEIIRGLKTFSARRINQTRETPGVPVWQRNYYEHIIRNDESLVRIQEYIANNPMQWHEDNENPAHVPSNVPVGAGLKPDTEKFCNAKNAGTW